MAAKLAYEAFVGGGVVRGERSAAGSVAETPLQPASGRLNAPQSPASGVSDNVRTEPGTPSECDVSGAAAADVDWIGQLNIWLARERHPSLSVDDSFKKEQSGPSHEPTFKCRLKVLDRQFEATGEPGQKWKEVRQMAAKLAYEAFVPGAT